MSPAFGVLILVLVLLVLFAWPTRARLTRAFTPPDTPHPIVRGLRRVSGWRSARTERRRRAERERRRRHLRAVR